MKFLTRLFSALWLSSSPIAAVVGQGVDISSSNKAVSLMGDSGATTARPPLRRVALGLGGAVVPSSFSLPKDGRSLQADDICEAIIDEQKTWFMPREDYEVADYFYDPNGRTWTCNEQPDGTYKVFLDFCTLCNPDGVCGRRTMDFLYTITDGVLGYDILEETLTYTAGRSEVLRGTWIWTGVTFECNSFVNGQPCSICEYQECAANPDFDHLILVCTNVPDGDTMNRCTEDYTQSNPHDGIFTIYNDNVVCADSANSGAAMPAAYSGLLAVFVATIWVWQ